MNTPGILPSAFALSLLTTVLCATGAERFVSPGGAHVAPFTDWANAATNIQEAIDVSGDGDTIWVTNGAYATGGKVMSGDLTNRVALDRALTVRSVNGPLVTKILGNGATNGVNAVRCAWLTNGANLRGFTLEAGATATAGSQSSAQSGGGAWASSASSMLSNCVLVGNSANMWGGGCYGGLLMNCRVITNWSSSWGGGAAEATLIGCSVQGNSAASGGGGVYNGSLLHCTVSRNSATPGGGGIYGASATNCVISLNSSPANRQRENWFITGSPSLKLAYTCTVPLPSGVGNISADPELVDFTHLAIPSPCRFKGKPFAGVPTDIDGEPWANPPSMGCDEVWEAGLVGPLAVSFFPRLSPITQGRQVALVGTVTGRASQLAWDYGDGSVETNHSYLAVNHTWTNPGNYTVTFTAFNTDHPEGVAMSLPLQVLALGQPLLVPEAISAEVFNLSFQGQPGVLYFFDQATNLAAPVFWQQLGVRYSTGEVMQVPLSKSTNDTRFYRVRTQ